MIALAPPGEASARILELIERWMLTRQHGGEVDRPQPLHPDLRQRRDAAVEGSWSITMYEIDQGWWFDPNPLNKFTASPRDDLEYNADGSLTLYFQKGSRGANKEANWRPAAKDDFIPACTGQGGRSLEPERHLEGASKLLAN
jgi:hypothetical protein